MQVPRSTRDDRGTRRGPLASPAARAVLALILGMAAGLAIIATDSAAGKSFATLIEPIGTLWVNAIRMTIIPLVVSLLIATIADARDLRAVGSLGVRSVVVFLVLLSAFALLSAVLSPLAFAQLTIDPAAAATLRSTLETKAATEVPGFASWVVGIVPTNPVKAAADGNMLSLIVFAVIFAAALAKARPALRDHGAQFFRAIADAMLIVVQWVLRFAPIGVFALAVTIATKLGGASVKAVGFYLVAHVTLVAVIGVLLYVIVALFGRVPLARFARACVPAQVVALSTRSSVAALPAMIEGAERVLKLPERVVGFVLPFGVSVFRLNSAASWIVSALFISKLYGIPLSAADIATIAGASVIFSFSVPGIPSGSLFVITPFFMQIGLPAEGIGILIALDAIPDMAKTLVNVTGHMTATVLVARGQGEQAA
jgi:proton glutamate symport protein